jgi:hypothetical protein
LVTENRLFSAFFLSFVGFFWFSGESPGGTPDYQRPPVSASRTASRTASRSAPADQPAAKRQH